MTTEPKNCHDTATAAKILGVATNTVVVWIRRGKFPRAVKHGGYWYIPKEDVAARAAFMKSAAYKPQGGRPPKRRVISPRKLAKIKGVSPNDVWRMQQEGLIPQPCTEDDL